MRLLRPFALVTGTLLLLCSFNRTTALDITESRKVPMHGSSTVHRLQEPMAAPILRLRMHDTIIAQKLLLKADLEMVRRLRACKKDDMPCIARAIADRDSVRDRNVEEHLRLNFLTTVMSQLIEVGTVEARSQSFRGDKNRAEFWHKVNEILRRLIADVNHLDANIPR